jgi:hypothetical protein
MAQVPDEIDIRMYPGDGEPGLADDNERSIAVLRIARATLEKERDEMESEYREVRRMQDEEIAALDAAIAEREGRRGARGEHGRLGAGDR